MPYAPLRRPDQLLDDPHLKESGQLMPVPMEGGRIGNLPKLPFASDAYDFTRAPAAADGSASTRARCWPRPGSPRPKSTR